MKDLDKDWQIYTVANCDQRLWKTVTKDCPIKLRKDAQFDLDCDQDCQPFFFSSCRACSRLRQSSKRLVVGQLFALHPYLVHYFDSSQPANLAGRPVLTPLAGRPVWGNLDGRPAWENLAGRPPCGTLAGRLIWDTLATWPQRDDKRRVLLTRKSFFFF